MYSELVIILAFLTRLNSILLYVYGIYLFLEERNKQEPMWLELFAVHSHIVLFLFFSSYFVQYKLRNNPDVKTYIIVWNVVSGMYTIFSEFYFFTYGLVLLKNYYDKNYDMYDPVYVLIISFCSFFILRTLGMILL